MKVLVTGAGGFLGRVVVAEAVAAGHEVKAMHRPASLPQAGAVPAGVTVVPGDLRQPGIWRDALGDVDAVIHCAAAASGDIATQLAGTVLATENLLAALRTGPKRFVHVSSFSVYDFGAPRWPAVLDESTPLERRPLRRDPYTQTKLQQEQMVREFCAIARRRSWRRSRSRRRARRSSTWWTTNSRPIGDTIIAPAAPAHRWGWPCRSRIWR